jgi:hypothetical protein
MCVAFAFGYNMFYVPFSIAFAYDLEGMFYFLDVLCITLFMVDILVRANTGYEN